MFFENVLDMYPVAGAADPERYRVIDVHHNRWRKFRDAIARVLNDFLAVQLSEERQATDTGFSP
ncbi:MAG: hypothetical protein R3E73_09705 [Porticoccaceae bacterium]